MSYTHGQRPPGRSWIVKPVVLTMRRYGRHRWPLVDYLCGRERSVYFPSMTTHRHSRKWRQYEAPVEQDATKRQRQQRFLRQRTMLFGLHIILTPRIPCDQMEAHTVTNLIPRYRSRFSEVSGQIFSGCPLCKRPLTLRRCRRPGTWAFLLKGFIGRPTLSTRCRASAMDRYHRASCSRVKNCRLF